MGSFYQSPTFLSDSDGNLVGVIYDGTTYRLQTESTLVDSTGTEVNVETTGTRAALAVSFPELLACLLRVEASLEKINAQLAEITGDEEPMK